jgi:DNA-3-methyladenine glycosylase II
MPGWVMARYKKGFNSVQASTQLIKADAAFRPWIKRIGALDHSIGWRQSFDVTDALARAILYQQLSGKAAATIVSRVELAIGNTRIHHTALKSVSDVQLRACGVSGNKVLALRDLARREAAGEIPQARQLQYFSNDQIIEMLVPTRGIGRWTVEMMLMFRLGRNDVLPIDDLGVRKGAQILDQLDVMPSPKELAQRGKIWSPNQTMASFYLWRIADFSKASVKRSQD